MMEIRKVAVVGCGAMGSGIAYVAAVNNFRVSVADQNEELVLRGLQRIKEYVIGGVNRGKLTPKQAEDLMKGIAASPDLGAIVKDADVVVEAVYEDLEVKKDIFRRLDELCSPHTIFASNTSSLSITEMASVTRRPEKVVGLHFFNPVPAMKLVEVVLGRQTSDETRKVAEDFAKRLGKETVTAKDSPGFIVNRVLGPMLNEVVSLLYEGVASAEDIDRALMLGTNLPMGPLRLADFVGLDVALVTIETLYRAYGDKYKPCPLLVEKVRAGQLGMKTGKGFYEYA